LSIEYGADLLQLPDQLPGVSPGNDLSKWTIKRWWFNGQFFNSIQDMISSWNADNKGIRSSFKLLKPGADSTLGQFSWQDRIYRIHRLCSSLLLRQGGLNCSRGLRTSRHAASALSVVGMLRQFTH
jgi:hypothetical protein